MLKFNLLEADFDTALNNIRNDIKNSPVYFSPLIKWNEIDVSAIIKQTKGILRNEKIELSPVDIFMVPYNLTSERESYALDIHKLLLRYVIWENSRFRFQNTLKSEIYSKERLLKIINYRIERDCNYVYQIDILDFYDSIPHDKLYKILAKRFHGTGDLKDYKKQFDRILKFPYWKGGEIRIKEKGLIIGNSADDFLAENYLNEVVDSIQTFTFKGYSQTNDFEGEFIRIADEFYLFGVSLNEIKNKFKLIEKGLSDFGLKINRSKSKLVYAKNSIFKPSGKIEIEITNLLAELNFSDLFRSNNDFLDENTFKINGYALEEKNEEIGKKKVFLSEDLILRATNNIEPSYCSWAWNSESNYLGKLNTHEDAQVFIEFLLKDQQQIQKYRLLFPENEKLDNLSFSQPTDVRNEFNLLSLELLKDQNIYKLSKVIHLFPKSQNFSWLAIKLLVYIAKNLANNFNEMDQRYMDFYQVNLRHRMFNASLTANMILIEMLQEEEISEYQKYLILRAKFFNIYQFEITFNNLWENYEVEISDFFINKYFEIFKSNLSSDSFPLKEISQYLYTYLKPYIG